MIRNPLESIRLRLRHTPITVGYRLGQLLPHRSPGQNHYISHFIRNVFQTVFRLLPWPTEPGLRPIGNPGPDSPVLVTCNYDLTVRRVAHAVQGLDLWLVVAPTRGINVWCAAAGGMMTSHQVITALKTSGIEDRVNHRRAILPQLAATGVLAKEVWRRAGWRVRFGPVYADDLPRYLQQDGKKTDDMRQVHFGPTERLEMACAWGVPSSMVVAGLVGLYRPAWIPPLVGLTMALALAVFFIYDRLPHPRFAILWTAATGGALGLLALTNWRLDAAIAAIIVSTVISRVLTIDYAGSTPIESASYFEQRKWKITLDLDRCVGVYSCIEVCPEGVFKPEDQARLVQLDRPEQCIRCGACVVQCPRDALFFTDEAGRRIEPAAIRQYKLNLLGQRGVQSAAHETAKDG